jgi:hypothetical protein
MQTLEAELPTLASRQERISAKRSAAQAELELAERARLELLTESDADDAKAEANAQARVHRARSTLEGFVAAAAELDAKIAAAEKSLAAEREKAERTATADKIEADAASAEEAIEALTALRKFAKALVPLRLLSFDAKQAEEMARQAAVQLELAARTALADVRAQANQVRNGTAKIPDLRPESKPAPPPAPAPTEKVFTLRKIKWTDADGKLKVAPAFQDAVLPPAAAAKALELGAAVPIDHERAKSIRGTRAPTHPDPKDCIALDAAAEQESPKDEINNQPAAQFQPLDRGGPYTAVVARNTIQ